MKCDVFDTHVTGPDGQQMHFDIIVPSGTAQAAAIAFGQDYLAEIGYEEGNVLAKQCRFCHVEQATQEMQQVIQQNGYFIVAMEGCSPVASD